LRARSPPFSSTVDHPGRKAGLRGAPHRVARPGRGEALHAEIVLRSTSITWRRSTSPPWSSCPRLPRKSRFECRNADPDASMSIPGPLPHDLVVPASSTPVTFEPWPRHDIEQPCRSELVPKRAVRNGRHREIAWTDIRWSKGSAGPGPSSPPEPRQYTVHPTRAATRSGSYQKRSTAAKRERSPIPPQDCQAPEAPPSSRRSTGRGNPVAYQTDASGCLYLPADATGTLQLSACFETLFVRDRWTFVHTCGTGD